MRYGKRFINKMRMFYQRHIHGVSKNIVKSIFPCIICSKGLVRNSSIKLLISQVTHFIAKLAQYTKCYVTMTYYEEVTSSMIPINTVELYNFPHI